MSNIPQQVLDLIDWVPKKRYMEMYGETADTISKRCQPKGSWKRGVHYNKPPGGGLWISLKAVNEWAKTLDQPGRQEP